MLTYPKCWDSSLSPSFSIIGRVSLSDGFDLKVKLVVMMPVSTRLKNAQNSRLVSFWDQYRDYRLLSWASSSSIDSLSTRTKRSWKASTCTVYGVSQLVGNHVPRANYFLAQGGDYLSPGRKVPSSFSGISIRPIDQASQASFTIAPVLLIRARDCPTGRLR